MTAAFAHSAVELTGLVSERLSDAGGLSAMVVAAAGAAGMPALGPPVVHPGPRATAVAMLCRDGHIVLHALGSEGICFVDVAARAPADPERAVEVIARRLGAA